MWSLCFAKIISNFYSSNCGTLFQFASVHFKLPLAWHFWIMSTQGRFFARLNLNQYLWMTQQTGYTDNDFWKCSWAHSVISITECLFLSTWRSWGVQWFSALRTEISPDLHNFQTILFRWFIRYSPVLKNFMLRNCSTIFPCSNINIKLKYGFLIYNNHCILFLFTQHPSVFGMQFVYEVVLHLWKFYLKINKWGFVDSQAVSLIRQASFMCSCFLIGDSSEEPPVLISKPVSPLAHLALIYQ